mmetsp:Transcript_25250/g.49345  ORF Transcript_25250/g.49345 Transcript_25250/m.49345 type:complete len:101 (+) Transcript_25250:620-922(+)
MGGIENKSFDAFQNRTDRYMHPDSEHKYERQQTSKNGRRGGKTARSTAADNRVKTTPTLLQARKQTSSSRVFQSCTHKTFAKTAQILKRLSVSSVKQSGY